MDDKAEDVLHVLHAARVELGRRLSEAWKRRDAAEVGAVQRQINVACAMTRAVSGGVK